MRGLLGSAYRRASAASAGSLRVLRAPLGFQLSVPFAFLDTPRMSILTSRDSSSLWKGANC